MNMDDFMRKVLEVLPNAEFEEDRDGQLIIATGMWQNPETNLVEEMP